MSTITQEQQQKIADYLATHELPRGLGTEEAACSIAAINLALSGELKDTIPDCMSHVIGAWVIRVQDAMPHDIRNYPKWKSLLPLAAGTGRDPAKEKARLALIMSWMWESLAHLQPLADARGFGDTWRKMLANKTAEEAGGRWAAAAAAAAAEVGRWAAAAAAAAAAAGRWAAAAEAAAVGRWAAAAEAAAAAAEEAAAAAEVAEANYWNKVDPCALLEKLVNA